MVYATRMPRVLLVVITQLIYYVYRSPLELAFIAFVVSLR